MTAVGYRYGARPARHRLLWLALESPWPATSGGRLRTAGLLASLQSDCEITLVVLSGDPPEDRGPLTAVKWLGCVGDRPSRAIAAAANLARGKPPYLRHFGTGRQRRFVGDVLADGRYDAVVADTPYPLTALPPYNSRDRTAVPVVVNTHNVEAEVWRSAGPAADGGRLPVTMDRLLAARWEVKALAQADGIAFCSARDADVLRKAVGADTVCAIVPNAVDTRTITLLPEPQSDDEVLFLGGLRYGPNAEAARFIVSRVAPLLLTAHCAVSIVGGLAGDIGCSSSPPNVRFMGRVRDVKPAYERCYATIVPLFSGSGTRLKVLESFAYGRPVVSSAKGVEGLAVQPERHYLQAEDAGQFVSQILRLRQDPHLVRDLVKNARDLAETRHSWATAGRAFHRLTEDVIERFA